MDKTTQTDNLNNKILLLQKKQKEELFFLKEQFHTTYESLKPINLIKSTFQEVMQSPELKDGFASNVIGYATGYLSKKFLVGKTDNLLKNIFGMLFQFAITNIASKHSEGIKTAGENLLKYILKFKRNVNERHHQNGSS